MAKSIITQDGYVLNYANILSIYVDRNPDVDDYSDALPYILTADVVAKVRYIVGEYETWEEAERAKETLIEWLQSEAFGVYVVSENKGDD